MNKQELQKKYSKLVVNIGSMEVQIEDLKRFKKALFAELTDIAMKMKDIEKEEFEAKAKEAKEVADKISAEAPKVVEEPTPDLGRS
jgi:hypothetical protein